MVAELTSGASADLIGQISSTRLMGSGYYSAYVGAVVDVVRLMTSFHTAEYQYIPALALPKGDQLNLQLNAPPSFVKAEVRAGDWTSGDRGAAASTIARSRYQGRRTACRTPRWCCRRKALRWSSPPSSGTIGFCTPTASRAHRWIFRSKPDAAKGGFVIDSHPQGRRSLRQDIHSSPKPIWRSSDPRSVERCKDAGASTPSKARPFICGLLVRRIGRSPPADQTALIAGRDDTVHLKSDQAVCVDDVTVQDAQGKKLKATHKLMKPDELQVDVALKDVAPGPLNMQVKQYGLSKPDEVSLHSYAEAGHLDTFTIDAGDHQGIAARHPSRRGCQPRTRRSAVFARQVESRRQSG